MEKQNKTRILSFTDAVYTEDSADVYITSYHIDIERCGTFSLNEKKKQL